MKHGVFQRKTPIRKTSVFKEFHEAYQRVKVFFCTPTHSFLASSSMVLTRCLSPHGVVLVGEVRVLLSFWGLGRLISLLFDRRYMGYTPEVWKFPQEKVSTWSASSLYVCYVIKGEGITSDTSSNDKNKHTHFGMKTGNFSACMAWRSICLVLMPVKLEICEASVRNQNVLSVSY